MIQHLGNGLFITTNHIVWGPPAQDDSCGMVPEALNTNLPMSQNIMDWNPGVGVWSMPRCGLWDLKATINGRECTVMICSRAAEAFMNRGTHGDFYMDTFKEAAEAMGEPVDLDFHDRRGNDISAYIELVNAWGFNNSLSNRIPAPRFIELSQMGRFKNSSYASRYATAILSSIGRSPSDDPVERVAKVFSKSGPMAELLSVLATNTTKSDRDKRTSFRQWSQPTKRTSITY